mgnify:FL=1
MSSPASTEHFVERQWPSFGAWVLAPGAGLLAGLALWPLSDVASIAAFVVVGVTAAVLLARTAEQIVVTGGPSAGLRAGRAFVEAEHLGTVTQLDAEATRAVLGRDADARAFLAQRGWIPCAVKVVITDPADPTPYWVVSTRKPQELHDALEAVRDGVSSRP